MRLHPPGWLHHLAYAVVPPSLRAACAEGLRLVVDHGTAAGLRSWEYMPGDDRSGRKPPNPPVSRYALVADEACVSAMSSTVHHAIRAGELLLEAKGRVGHGEWLPWLAANFEAGERTARRYMTIASNRTRVADLPSVREALAELATPRDKPKPKKTAART